MFLYFVKGLGTSLNCMNFLLYMFCIHFIICIFCDGAFIQKLFYPPNFSLRVCASKVTNCTGRERQDTQRVNAVKEKGFRNNKIVSESWKPSDGEKEQNE